jgi:hypothetical protein
MNISHKHKTIWWAPERTGTKITREIFSKYDFFVFDPKTEDEVSIQKRNTSHLNEIPEKYSDYMLISSVRNPYDRVLSIFLNTVYENIALEKDKQPIVRKSFNKWIMKAFLGEKMIVTLDKNYSAKNINYNYFSKWTYNGKKPDFFIRMENIKEDLENLDFIKNDVDWNSTEVGEILENNVHKTNRTVKFDQMYDLYSAKLVYLYYKLVFNLVPYNPFSFTTETLSESEKISFFHDIP